MVTFSTSVIENRKRRITNLAISISNEGTKRKTVVVEVYDVPSLGLSNAVVYFLHELTLNPFDTPNSTITFDNVFANLDRFGVRVITSNPTGMTGVKDDDDDRRSRGNRNKNRGRGSHGERRPEEKNESIAVTVTGLDAAANTDTNIFPGDLLEF
ncbi:hypothetical protein [Paenibacillus piri]|uniref:Uncharacterized protein n=1 Tax=Paenibacillus piri TaxID=2547395 RepID=A0A4R5KWE2_9BACL|nr:hypothetical protein [Paenibacillus piri]TDG00340.1 hypothetical protein E1757_01470 [Paenibacillus piri]